MRGADDAVAMLDLCPLAVYSEIGSLYGARKDDPHSH